jgi:hypothetical protein
VRAKTIMALDGTSKVDTKISRHERETLSRPSLRKNPCRRFRRTSEGNPNDFGMDITKEDELDLLPRRRYYSEKTWTSIY